MRRTVDMKQLPPDLNQAAQLTRIANSLVDIRNALMMISLALNDLKMAMPSRERDEVMVDVQRYLKCIAAPRH
jgi:hypothetical protein